MAKYDVFSNPNGQGCLLDVQSDLLDVLNTRLVVPLMPVAQAPRPAARLNPVFRVNEADMVMVTQFMATVPRAILGKPVANLKAEFEAVTVAIDMLVQGF